MAYEQQQICISKAAASDLSANQYCFVKMSGSGADTVTVCTAQGEQAIGVLQNKPKTGQPARICICGVTKLYSDDIIDDQEQITTETNGHADIAASSDYVLGISLHGGTCADGDIITAAVNCISAPVLA
jgi:hypothetical protein